ncbi:hypothetical protein [uncultured Chitinophaga sp.]|uniref:hypothetical protein n=1 Tax=uncultured Chitinophaga sp. TaxID=339340 RepID=UPI0025DEB2BD|nr:hypothetical protein [uncultured Chitinophaga sp.]
MNTEDIALRVLEIAFTAIVSSSGGYFAGKNAFVNKERNITFRVENFPAITQQQ